MANKKIKFVLTAVNKTKAQFDKVTRQLNTLKNAGAGVASFTTSGRDTAGEYISSVYDAITNLSAGWHGGQTNHTGSVNAAAGSYQGIDGVTRSAGQIVGNGNFPNYNGYCFGYVFPASTNFELTFSIMSLKYISNIINLNHVFPDFG